MKNLIPRSSHLCMVLLLAAICLYMTGCGPKEEGHSGHSQDTPETGAPYSHDEHQHESKEQAHGQIHAHTAPHGGTLVILGEHFAIIEIVMDTAAGKMTAYVLDGEAEKPVRIPQTTLEILVLKPGSPTSDSAIGDTLKLNAVANALTGETVGNTSEFNITSELLKGKDHFEGIIQSVTLKGEEKKTISFKFPEGNE